MSHRLLMICCLVVCWSIVGLTAAQAWAGPLSETVVFGDSLSDTGNLFDATFGFIPAPPNYEGRFSNGPLWVERLAEVLVMPSPTPSRDGGTNSAYGGAETGPGQANLFSLNLGRQVSDYLAGHTLAADQLVAIWGGANDFLNDPDLDAAVPVANMSDHIAALAAAGGEHFLVPNLPPLGQVPQYRNTALEATLDTAAGTFNLLLAAELNLLETSLDVTIHQLDVHTIFTDALTEPAAFGLVNVTDPAFDEAGGTVVPNPDEYLFWDEIHPTTAAHRILGDRAAALLLPGPAGGVVSLDSFGQSYTQDFNALAGFGGSLPVGWTTDTAGTVNTTITEPFPPDTVTAGTYNAGTGADRSLATGNTDRTAPNAIQFWAELTGTNAVRAVVIETRVEAWHGDAAADNPGEAAWSATLQFDPAGDGIYSTAALLNGGVPITTGLELEPGALDGNGPHAALFSSGLVEVDIPAGSNVRLTLDAQNTGATQGYIFGVDDFLLRIVSPGDTDGDGDMESDDLFRILAAGKFNNPAFGPADWSEGDHNGDGLVNSDDLFLILAAAHFNAGPYTQSPRLAVAAPEPPGWLTAAVGLCGLVILARRRSRAEA